MKGKEDFFKEYNELMDLLINVSKKVGDIIKRAGNEVLDNMNDKYNKTSQIKDKVIKDNNFKAIIRVTNPTNEWVRARILEVGSKIGSVHFYKRGDGELRKMSYRVNVFNPKFSNSPKTMGAMGSDLYKRKIINELKGLITVYDVNKVLRDNNGNISGRGDYRSIPLEKVIRIVSNGYCYEILRN